MKLQYALLIAAALITAPAAEAASPLKTFGIDDAPIREVAQTALRHLLNFRKETPPSAEQKKEVAAVLKQHRPEIRSQIEQGRDARRSMEAAVKEHGADSPETKAAADKIGEAARDRALLVARIAEETRPLLTEAQQKRLDDARKDIQATLDDELANLTQ